MIGKAVGFRIELAVGHTASVARYGDRCRRPRRLCREAFSERGIELPVGRDARAECDDGRLLGRRRDSQASDRAIGVSRGRGQQSRHAVEHPHGRGSLEQVGGVFEAEFHHRPGPHREQGHVEVRDAAVERQRLGREPRQPQHNVAVVLPGEHHLKHRCPPGIAACPQQIHHAFEWQLRMSECPKQRGPHPGEQLSKRRIARQVDADRQRVHEKPDHTSGIWMIAIGVGRAHDKVMGLAPTTEHGHERGEQHRERGR